MNIRLFKIFLTVCEVGNMTHAARILYMSQPSVSQAIVELEKYYGVRLFERLNHRLYLTEAGERLRSYAQHIFNMSEQVRKELADLGQAGTIRIGASLTVGAYLLPELVAGFHRRYPEIEVFTLVDNTALIEEKILEDQLDLGLVEGPVSSSYITEEAYSDDYLVFIASPLHPLAKRPAVSAQDLSGQAFIMREAGSASQAIFEHTMQAARVNWKVAGIYNNNEAVKQAVSANLGLAVVSKIAITEELRLGKLVSFEVKEMPLTRRLNLIYHRQKFFTRAMQLFRNASISVFSHT